MSSLLLLLTTRPPPRPTLFPYTTLFRSWAVAPRNMREEQFSDLGFARQPARCSGGQMSTRPGERRVPFEECCFDHQRVGAADRLDEAGDLLGVADNGERRAGYGCAVDHFGHDM